MLGAHARSLAIGWFVVVMSFGAAGAAQTVSGPYKETIKRALGLLSTLSGPRLVQALRDHDLGTLQSVPRVGRKKAEQMILDLADKLDDLQVQGGPAGPRPQGAGADDAMRALVSLGYSSNDAERAVRLALDEDGKGLAAADLIRRALAKVAR